MDRRKVQRTGGSTFIISLPKKWVEANGIRQGDALDVQAPAHGPVTLWPAGQTAQPTRMIELEIKSDHAAGQTERQVIAAYLAGYETITVRSEGRFTAEQKESVRRLAQTLIGIEIAEEGIGHITLHDLLDPVDFNIARALDRMHQLTHSMVADALTALAGGESDLATDIPRRDPEIDRLDWMIVKQFHLLSSSSRLAGELQLTPSEALHFLLVSTALERIADHAARLAEIQVEKGAGQIPVATKEELTAYGRLVLGLTERAYGSFTKRNADAANDVLVTSRDAQTEATRLLGKGKGLPAAAQVSLALLVKSVERIRSYTMDIAEAAIDHDMIRRGT